MHYSLFLQLKLSTRIFPITFYTTSSSKQSTMVATKSILIINPNSTSSMTEGLKPLVDSLGFNETSHNYFTAPSGPTSINNDADVAESATHCLPALRESKDLSKHDGFLVACYSKHPLVNTLREQDEISRSRKPVVGIFEASVTTSLQLIQPHEKFGIVSTGRVWERSLTDAVNDFLGSNARFAGVETTGLNATELHDTSQQEVKARMKDATRRLLRKGNVGAVCLGCAGMSGMEEWVREAAVEELGEEGGRKVRVVDGVQAGVASLEGVLRAKY